MPKKRLTPKATAKTGKASAKARTKAAKKAEEEKDEDLAEDEEDQETDKATDTDPQDDPDNAADGDDDEDPDNAADGDDDEDPDKAADGDDDEDDEEGDKTPAAKSSAKARIKAILGSEEAKSRPKLAQHLALETNVSVATAKATLKVAQKETGSNNGFASAMGDIDNPKLKQGGGKPTGASAVLSDMQSRFPKK